MSGFTCPYLARADDRDTAFAFASPGHRCFRLSAPSPVTVSHQTTYCLTDEYTECPVFHFASSLEPDDPSENQAETGSTIPLPLREEPSVSEIFPENTRPEGSIKTRFDLAAAVIRSEIFRITKKDPNQNPAVPAIFLTVVSILFVSILFFTVVFISSFTSPAIDETPIAEEAAVTDELQPNIFLVTITPTQRSAFIKKMGIAGVQAAGLPASSGSADPDSTSVTIVVTPTPEPTPAVYHACGAPSDWAPYIVQAGDSLSGLSVEYDVPLYELSSNNCLGVEDNLFIGTEIYVPAK